MGQHATALHPEKQSFVGHLSTGCSEGKPLFNGVEVQAVVRPFGYYLLSREQVKLKGALTHTRILRSWLTAVRASTVM